MTKSPKLLFLCALTLAGGSAFAFGINGSIGNVGRDHSQVDPIVVRDLTRARQFEKDKSWTKSAELLARHANGNNHLAKYRYALLQLKGWGVDRDLEGARDLLLQTVQQPFKHRAKAAFELGRIYRMSRGEDCPRIAFEWFKKSVLWGYPKGHNEIGKSYARGIGVEQNIDLALKHYRLAAKHGSPTAVLPIIQLLASGNETVKADPVKARKVAHEFMPSLVAAAKGGNARAARSIARLRLDPVMGAPDKSEALKWFSVAVRLGDAIAMHDMALLLLSDRDSPVSKQEILDLLNESIRRDYAAAVTTLGRLHLQSRFGLPEAKAVELFQQGVRAGHPGSMEELGRLYLLGKHIEHDLTEARNLAEQGSRLKHTGSRKLLAEIIKAEDRQKEISQKLTMERG